MDITRDGSSLQSRTGDAITLAGHSKLHVRQHHELGEWFGFETRNKYEISDESGRPVAYAAEQSKGGVVWLAINSGAPGKQGAGAERNREAATEWKLEHPILLDEDGKVGHAYGATTTPHMFVIDGTGKLVFAGGVDNAPLGKVDG